MSRSSAATCDAGLQLGTFPRMYYNRWIVLMFYLVAEIFLGLPYSIGLFSQAMKNDLGLNQVKVSLVASFGQMGFLGMAFFAGLLLGMLKPIHQRYYLLVAACMISGGLLYMGMTLKGYILVNVGAMCVTWFFANFGVVMVMSISIKVNVGNFPQKDRGKICGLVQATFGMSSAVFSVLFDSYFSARSTKPEATFALYLSIITFSVVCLSAIPTNVICPSHIDYVPEHAQGIVPSFRPMLFWKYVVLMTLVALVICELAGVSIANVASGIVASFFILCGYAIPCIYGSAMVSTLGPENKLKPAAAPVSDPAMPKIISEGGCICDVEEDSNVRLSTSDVQPPSLELPWYEALLDRRFWAVFMCFCADGGAGLMLFNNVTSIATSVGLEPRPAFVGLMGLGNAFSRSLSGVLADIIRRHGLPRSFILLIVLGGAAGNYFLLSMGTTSYLYAGLFIGTLCFGPLPTTAVGLMADYFGTKHVAINYGMQDVGPALSSFALSTGVVSLFYEADESGNCIGRECFQNTFIIAGCLCTVCFPIVFFILLKPDYAQLQKKILTTSTNDVGKGENGETSMEDIPSETTLCASVH